MDVDQLVKELDELELQLKNDLIKYNLWMNTCIASDTISADDTQLQKLMLSCIIKVSYQTQKKNIELIEKYKDRLRIINEEIHRRSSLPAKHVKKHKKTLFIPNEKLQSHNAATSFYFHNGSSRCLHKNEDMIDIQRSGYRFINCHRTSRRWIKSDYNRLFEGIRIGIKCNTIDELEKLLSLIQVSNEEDETALSEQAFKLTEFLMEFDTFDIHFLLQGRQNEIFNWEYIASKCLQGRHSPQEIKSMWDLVANPDIQNNKWTPEEDVLLRILVSENNFQNWDKINKTMPTPRSEFICFSRYVSLYKRKHRPAKKWTEEDNIKLESIQTDVPLYEKWILYAGTIFKNASKTQIKNHVEYLNTTRGKKKGVFSKREKFVVDSYLKRGFSYKAVANILRNRTEKQICDHYRMTFKPLARSKWTKNSERNLLLAVRYLGAGNWKKISQYMNGWTAIQCRNKFEVLLKNQSNYVEEFVKRKSPNMKSLVRNTRQFLRKTKSKRNKIDKKIELYFINKFEADTQMKSNIQAEHTLNILRFLDFDVTSIKTEYVMELNNWLNNYPTSNSDMKLKCDKFFEKKFLDIRKTMKIMHVRNVQNIFSAFISKSRVLPPSKCTLYGLHNFKNNYDDYAAKNKDVNYEILWKQVNAAQIQKKYFNQSKLMWYRTLKAVFYWPIKLKMAMPEDLTHSEKLY